MKKLTQKLIESVFARREATWQSVSFYQNIYRLPLRRPIHSVRNDVINFHFGKSVLPLCLFMLAIFFIESNDAKSLKIEFEKEYQLKKENIHLQIVNEECTAESNVSFGFCNLYNQKFKGVSIGLINRTKSIEGVQIGLLNIVENNPKYLRVLPFLNLKWEKNN